MQFGYLTHNHIDGVRPDLLARELDTRGYESIWVPEHSHIPVDSGAYPGGGDMPDSAWKVRDPFVSLALASTGSDRLRLGTGVCLLLQHDLMDLVCTTATLDRLSGGRLLLGGGVGWNALELADHRPDVPFGERYDAFEERVRALRWAWRSPSSGFLGRWDRFRPSRVEPAPTRGTVPIHIGATGVKGMEHAARYGDGWCPVSVGLVDADGRRDVGAAIERFRGLLDRYGRDPLEVPISLFWWGGEVDERLERACSLDVERIVFMPRSSQVHAAVDTLKHLDSLQRVVDHHADAPAQPAPGQTLRERSM